MGLDRPQAQPNGEYQLDENMPRAVTEGLRRPDVDVTTTADGGPVGATDQEQLLFGRGEGRVLVTRDAELLPLDA